MTARSTSTDRHERERRGSGGRSGLYARRGGREDEDEAIKIRINFERTEGGERVRIMKGNSLAARMESGIGITGVPGFQEKKKSITSRRD